MVMEIIVSAKAQGIFLAIAQR
uniref:Uncharacterized protein n=1 Tax=Arundo donax TaxID=35708 RepID=A0A0A8ZVW7_ARUDO